jgi:hypothetical protein
MMGLGSQATARGLVAVSADGKPMPIPAIQDKLPENTAAQETGGLLVTLALSPYPPSGAKASDFDITLTDANGQAVSDATVSLDLTMPEMPMPANQPTADNVGAGKYHATSRFTMRGWWRIEVIITRGGQKQSAFFDIGL